MKRKINLVGQSTLTVSLPNKWVEKHGIKKGDELEIEEEGNELIIAKESRKNKAPKGTEIKFTAVNWSIIRSTLGGLYKKGFDVIRIRYDDEQAYDIIDKSINNLIGYEIFDKSEGGCTIKNLVSEIPDPEKEIFNILNRFVNSIKTMRTIVREDYISGKHDRFEEVVSYRNNGWKFRDYAMRIAFNQLDDSPSKHGLIVIIWSLEKINRNYMYFYGRMKTLKSKKNNELLKLYDDVSDYIDLFFTMLHKTKMEDIEKLNEQHDKHSASGFEIVDNLKKDNSLALFLIENVQRVQDLGTPLIQVYF